MTETKNHPNAGLTDLRLGDEMIELLKSSERMDNFFLCELVTHSDFPQFMADLEIYVNRHGSKASTDRKCDSRRYERNHYEAVQSQYEHSAVKTAYCRSH